MIEHWRNVAWVRDWQFWVVLGLAAVLRLIGILHSPFTSDAALSFLEVARSWHDHTLPVTGEFDSILALEPPAYSFIILPFANHPFVMALITALANTLAVGLTYVLGARYFGRAAGFVAGLLMATGLYVTWMSEFLWPPTLTIPATLAALYFLYRGAVARKPFWLGPHLILVAIAVQLHPIAASLLPVTVVGIVFGWSALRIADVALGIAGSIVLLLPTAVFEYVSGGLDLPAYEHWLALPKVVDGQVFISLIESLGPRPADYFGPTVYTQVEPWLLWLKGGVGTLWLIASLWLIVRLSLPLVRRLRQHGLRTYRHVLDVANDAGWRAQVLLLLWPLCLLAMTVRHATPVYPQYVYLIDPVAYLTIAVAATQISTTLHRLASRVAPPSSHPGRPRRALFQCISLRTAAGMPAATVTGIVGAQLIVTSVFVFVLASGMGWGWSWSGIPVVSSTGALSTTLQWAAKLHAQRVYIVADPGDPYMGQYWAQLQTNLGNGSVGWSSYVAQDCILAPPRGQPGILLTLTNRGVALNQLVHDEGTRLLQSVPVARGTSYDVYALPQIPSPARIQATLNGEIELNSAFIAAGAGSAARLITTWTVLQSSSSTSSVAQYHFHFLFQQGAHFADAKSSCTPSSWLRGERLTVVTALPAGLNPTGSLAPRVIVSRDTHTWYRPQFGPFVLDTAKELTSDNVVLPPGTTHSAGIADPNQHELDASTVAIDLSVDRHANAVYACRPMAHAHSCIDSTNAVWYSAPHSLRAPS